MKASASIELVMQIATYEAVAAKFREVEPEHLLMALLKFAELPIEEMGKLAAGGVAAKHVGREVSAVGKELTRRSVESTKIRRELRVKMGRGNSPFSGGVVHRSVASRQIFDVAGKLADDTGSDAVTAEHILEALMRAPTRLIEQVLGNAVGVKVEERKDTPLLDEYGKDLTKLVAEGRLPPVSNRTAECKAVVEALKQPDRRCVLLISDNDQVVESVVFAVAHAIGKKNFAGDLKDQRIIDVTNFPPIWKWDKNNWEQFRRLIAEGASAENVILFVPPVQNPPGLDVDDEWSGLLKKTLAKTSTQCVCRVEPATYKNCIKKDFGWKQFANVIWIHDEIKDEVPREL